MAESQIIPDLPIDSMNEDGWTALQLAALHGQTGIVEKLLQHGAEVNVSRDIEEGIKTTLQGAATAGHLKIVNQLLVVEAEVNAKPAKYCGQTALQGAAENGHLDVVKRLLGGEADVNAAPAPRFGRTALQGAAAGGHLEIVRCLLDAGAHINTLSESSSPLRLAEDNGHVEVANLRRKTMGM